MRRVFGLLVRLVLALVGLLAAYVVLLCVPEPMFAHSVRVRNLMLYSDRTLSQNSAHQVLELARGKLQTSPLYDDQIEIGAFVCNDGWRQRLFFNTDYRAGGLAYPFSMKVFLRSALVDENRLISPAGKPVEGVRTLDYFVTHEMVHALTSRKIGVARYLRLPQWIREGYADYVARGSTLDYEKARQAFLAEEKDMDYARSGLYWRFAFLVAHVLDRKGWTVDRLLTEPLAEQHQVESEIRAGR